MDLDDPTFGGHQCGATHWGRMRIKYRLLVVDDDPSILELTTSVLLDEGYDVVAASDGAEAIEVATTSRLDGVLLDLRMPDVSGWDVARELKKRGKRVPIIVITASPDAAHSAHEIGAAGYVEKPFTIVELLDAVKKICRPVRPSLSLATACKPVPSPWSAGKHR